MRIGYNPQKDKLQKPTDFFHQVVIPVYIPNQEDYFKDSFVILQYCLNSLFKTCHSKTYITVVNNGSCEEVMNYLNNLFHQGKIHELVNTTNIGYINAMLKGISGQNFIFFTTADADVLFLEGWQKESYRLFEAFPKAGAVSPSPNSRTIRYFTSNILFEKGFSGKMKFTENKASDDMVAFAKSVGNEKLFNAVNLKKYLTISKGDVLGLVGGGHFIVTYRSEIFESLEKRYTKFILGGGSDFIFDKPVVKKGFWRLSTVENYAFHMGNTKEDWMSERLGTLHENNVDFQEPALKKINNNKCLNWFKTEIFSRLIFREPFWRIFLQYKGLTKEEAKKYLS